MSAGAAAQQVLEAVEANATGIAPGTYPGEDGGVILEWGSPQKVVTLEISSGETFFLFHLDVPSREAVEFSTGEIAEAIQRVGQALAA